MPRILQTIWEPWSKKLLFSLKVPNTYTELDTSLVIPMDQTGLYECVITAPGTALKNEQSIRGKPPGCRFAQYAKWKYGSISDRLFKWQTNH